MVQITHDTDFAPHVKDAHAHHADWLPDVRVVPNERPWDWLAAGWRDMTAAPIIGTTYGAIAVVSSFILFAGLALEDMHYLILPLAGGFMLLGPIFAVGLYETSRLLENGEHPSLDKVLMAYRRNGAQLAIIGMTLLIMFMAWIRLAFLLFMLFFSENPPALDMLVDKIFFSEVTPLFLLTGTAVGFVMAAAVFSLSVVAIPLLLDRQTDAFTAMAASVKAVKASPKTMLIWAALIALFTSAGIATGFLGLLLAFPLIGHASWHCYRDVVKREDA